MSLLRGAPTFFFIFCGREKLLLQKNVNTIADGVATSSPPQAAFDIILAGASRIVTVSDKQIKAAMLQYYQSTHNLVEGAGAAPLAALNKESAKMKGKKVGLILSGGMIDLDRFMEFVKP